MDGEEQQPIENNIMRNSSGISIKDQILKQINFVNFNIRKQKSTTIKKDICDND